MQRCFRLVWHGDVGRPVWTGWPSGIGAGAPVKGLGTACLHLRVAHSMLGKKKNHPQEKGTTRFLSCGLAGRETAAFCSTRGTAISAAAKSTPVCHSRSTGIHAAQGSENGDGLD